MHAAVLRTTPVAGLALLGCGLPYAALCAGAGLLAAQTVITGLNLWTVGAGPLPPAPPGPARRGGCPFFSVHVATHDEPPALVCDTLAALRDQRGAPPFEVIVLDNNTPDPAVWAPVAAWCEAAGPRFRFHHRDGVSGAKAGALNIALGLTDPRATHVVVIDADYRAEPDFLAAAAQALEGASPDFVQFPQAYRDGEDAGGVVLELSDYFTRHARAADGANAMLLTGTLSVIDRQALERVGGWSGATLTEDAELALRLRGAGFNGRLDTRIGGRGLLPLDFDGLSKQRYRWAAGNVACLRALSGLPRRTALQTLAQLTAWANFGLPAMALMTGGWMRTSVAGPDAATSLAMTFCGLAIGLILLGAVLPLAMQAAAGPARRGDTLSAIATRIALLPASARGTLDGLARCAGGFRRTPKAAGTRTPPAWLRAELTVPGALGLLMLLHPAGPPLAQAAAALLALPLACAPAPCRALATYRHRAIG